MLYILEFELAEKKSIFYALTHIFGIGKFKSNIICKKLGLSKNYKIINLSKEQINKLIRIIESSNILFGNDLKKFRTFMFKKLVAIKSYRGLRKNQGLPVRGQRTHTNSRTSRKISF